MSDISEYQFHREHDGSLSLESAVFQALGSASTCWDSTVGVFHEHRARMIGDALVGFIRENEKSNLEPRLGLATTKELLAEVEARMRITQNSLKGRELGEMCRQAIENLDSGVLNYRTFD